MTSVADCFRQHAPDYLNSFGKRIPLGHRRVISLITRCRTGQLGHVLFECRSCGEQHFVGRSCGNRHCPTCGGQKTAAWLAKQTDKLLPVHHFLLTFTVPEELRSVLRGCQRDGYAALFEAGSETIRDLGASSKYLSGCTLGYFGVLHTWGRDPLVYHPHIHFVVPGGGVNEAAGRWQQTPENFLFVHSSAMKVYKGKLADQLHRCGLHGRVDPSAWKKNWTVDIKPVGDGRAVLKYLAPYVHRVAISNSRIVGSDDESVTYRYTPSGKQRSLQRTVTGSEFLRGFLQHTLPTRFQKIRYYGWMSPASGIALDEVRWCLWLYLGWTFWLGCLRPKKTPPAKPRCSECGGELEVLLITDHHGRALYQHSVPYRDTG